MTQKPLTVSSILDLGCSIVVVVLHSVDHRECFDYTNTDIHAFLAVH
jgi:hypothetical protein